MATGTVKWFDDVKGYGFITNDDGGSDLFTHFSAIKASGFKTLSPNQKVSFDVTTGPKGKRRKYKARGLICLEESPVKPGFFFRKKWHNQFAPSAVPGLTG